MFNKLKKAILTVVSISLFGCISIYKDDINISNSPSGEISARHQVQVEVGAEKFKSESTKKISIETKEKIKNQIDLNITDACIATKQLKGIEVSYFTSHESDGTCWLFNLCYLVWPAINISTHAIKFKINNSEEHVFEEKIRYRQYAHLLLIPALLYKPFDTRKDEAFVKLADSFSKSLCKLK